MWPNNLVWTLTIDRLAVGMGNACQPKSIPTVHYVSAIRRFRDPPKHAKVFHVCRSTGSFKLLAYVDKVVQRDFLEGFLVTEIYSHLLSHFPSSISKKPRVYLRLKVRYRGSVTKKPSIFSKFEKVICSSNGEDEPTDWKTWNGFAWSKAVSGEITQMGVNRS